MAVTVKLLGPAARTTDESFPNADAVAVDDVGCLVVLRNAGDKDEETLAVYAPGVWASGKVT